jgi:hypothetical protein
LGSGVGVGVEATEEVPLLPHPARATAMGIKIADRLRRMEPLF